MRKFRLASTLALVLLAGSLTACHALPPNAGPLPASPVTAPAILPVSLDISQANQTETDPLNLTDEQKKQFAAINQETEKSDRSAALQRVLLAPQIDAASLRSQLTQTASDIDQTVNTQIRLRNILTPQQRQTLAESYRSASQSDSSMTDSQMKAMQEDLKLTAEQSRLFSAMNDAMKRHAEANRTRLRDAQITLLTTGEGGAFRAALVESNRTMPLDAMVAFFSSLNQSQRQSLFSGSSASGSNAQR